MDTAICPACGEEINKDVENCPICGAPVGVLKDTETLGAPIDNSAAIDSMLKSASRFMEESSSLGLGNLEETAEEAGNEDDSFSKVELNPLPPELSSEQKDKIQSGGIINLSPASGNAPEAPSAAENAPSKKPQAAPEAPQPAPKAPKAPDAAPKAADKKPQPAPKLDTVDEMGNVVKPAPAPKPPEVKPEPKQKTKQKMQGASPSALILTAVIALIIGVAGGFLGKLFLFPQLPTPDCQEFAERAVSAVSSVLDENEELYIAQAYVKESSASTQCVLRILADSGDDTAQSLWFRVRVDSDTPNVINVYTELDEEVYESLKSSDNAEDQVQAAMLMNSQKELELCLEEIQSGTGWSSANIALLNNTLHPYSAQGSDEEADEEAQE